MTKAQARDLMWELLRRRSMAARRLASGRQGSRPREDAWPDGGGGNHDDEPLVDGWAEPEPGFPYGA